MGRDGLAYLFVAPDQGAPLTAIEMLINKTIPCLHLDDFKGFRKAEKATAGCRVLYTTGAGSASGRR
jgi:ATP-dependent RNA helicase DeaD